ncbi:aminotransferase class I/II-fold pyridoxal phosphate-dependent enzyme [Flavobacteriaceae bacterium S0825]|uniref:aminotransferase class I/II-fold pyridoxal phosphate-dependent enzyme n=1 Tax=Gaetbulibacter sp. S0825 TaxID=2720084 RepID=UPI001430DF78|nr:aminotransferase class I/II-fold pyridoxal phosphate-dependent enzyme [Gaetbulibacter sp. S0825]MCK0109020.1 aminotransferase class I/II-fold pyridoxal phosphate-dependent enzyme [Flavobacteriaceae bacterium S0825]NIX64655.1 DegT/DnrJ/EryC1/StrS aminotransferase family protein [Gaetbulibacter sp. S0825]
MKPNNSIKTNNLPPWDEFQKMVQGIWEREYYTNHGPLVVDLENRIENLLGVKNAVCMTNSSIALMIAIKALDINKKVLIPSFSHLNIAQSVEWAGVEAEFGSIKNDSFVIDPKGIQAETNENIELVIAVNDFGMVSEIDELEELARQKNFRLIFVSDSFFGENYKEKKFGHFGDIEIFSFNESQLINGADGACICTSDNLLADKLRNIRSSYGAVKKVPIPYTGNGRMSEIQAGLSLLSLDNFENKRNEVLKRKNEFNTIVEKTEGVSIYNSINVCCNFILVLNCVKLGINLKDVTHKLKLINKHIELFKFYGVEIYSPYKRKSFPKNSLIDSSIGLPSNITSEEFNEVVSILTQNIK